jgi:hypothetical protein
VIDERRKQRDEVKSYFCRAIGLCGCSVVSSSRFSGKRIE